MKTKISITLFFAIAIIFSACEPRDTSSIVGEWEYYSEQSSSGISFPGFDVSTTDIPNGYLYIVSDDGSVDVYISGIKVQNVEVNVIDGATMEYTQFNVDELLYFISNDTLKLTKNSLIDGYFYLDTTSYYFVKSNNQINSLPYVGQWEYIYRKDGNNIFTPQSDNTHNLTIDIAEDNIMYIYRDDELIKQEELNPTKTSLYHRVSEGETTSISYFVEDKIMTLSTFFLTNTQGRTYVQFSDAQLFRNK